MNPKKDHIPKTLNEPENPPPKPLTPEQAQAALINANLAMAAASQEIAEQMGNIAELLDEIAGTVNFAVTAGKKLVAKHQLLTDVDIEEIEKEVNEDPDEPEHE